MQGLGHSDGQHVNLAVVQSNAGVGEPVALHFPPLLEVSGFQRKAGAKEKDGAVVLNHVPEPCTAVHMQIVLSLEGQSVVRGCIIADTPFIVVG